VSVVESMEELRGVGICVCCVCGSCSVFSVFVTLERRRAGKVSDRIGMQR